MKATFQTRIKDLAATQGLDQMGPVMAHATRVLFSKIAKNQEITKSELQKSLKLTSRLYNSCKTEADARYQNCRENKANQVISLEARIKAVTKSLRRPLNLDKRHHKTRRLQSLKDRLETVKREIKERSYSCVFGSQELWNKQFHLDENQYSSHQTWKDAWVLARNYNFLILGSSDETSGNQSCTISANSDGSYHLRLRLPPILASNLTSHLVIPNLRFSYGHEIIEQVFHLNLDETTRQAISYRFHKDSKGWIVSLTTELTSAEITTSKDSGVLGVDLNSDHLAITETDRFGNPVQTYTLELALKGKSQDQSVAIIGEAAKALVDLSLNLKKSIVIEKLDFEAKKATLAASQNPKYAAMLSSFAYSKIRKMIEARASRLGAEILNVNPAYTSFIGLLKFSSRYGLTTHHAAALVIGRRCYQFSERLPVSKKSYQFWIKDVLVTLEKPETLVDSSGHVRTSWGKLKRKMEAFWQKRRTQDPKRASSTKNSARSVTPKRASMVTKKLNPKKAVPS